MAKIKKEKKTDSIMQFTSERSPVLYSSRDLIILGLSTRREKLYDRRN